MVRRPCLSCPALAEPGKPRCEPCRLARVRAINRVRGSATARGYGSAWARHAKAAIAAYRAAHGDICPGWDRAPHAIDPKSWCCDHQTGPLCRGCNSRKAATVDKLSAAARRAEQAKRGIR
jgi:5-methylcytosine-specific restriction protein A